MLESIKRVLVSYIVRLLPETSFFTFKRFLYQSIGHEIGNNTRICSSARILGAGKLIVGNNVWIGPEVLIACSSKIIIEDNVDIAPRVYIGTGTHNIGDIKGRMAGTGLNKNIIIGKGTWLCANVSIMPGVVIGKMNIINAGSVVTKATENNMLLAGIPAKVIKNLREEKKHVE
ncbi:acyltransferase [Empedobacter falsenii]